jgi:GGDEF domain-containing protein
MLRWIERLCMIRQEPERLQTGKRTTMHISNKINLANMESRNVQLVLLACAVIFILSAGLALLMYPAVFSQPVVLQGETLRVTFFGFCAVSVLLIAYLAERQTTISRLRRRVLEEQRQALEARRQASADLINALPNLNSFRDRLPMEYRRAASVNQNLLIFVITVTPADGCDPGEHSALIGDAAKSMGRKLRAEDSLYLLFPGYFGIVLPGCDGVVMRNIEHRLGEGLSDAAGVNNRFSYEIKTVKYPENAKSAQELEQAVCNLLPAAFWKGDSFGAYVGESTR